MRLCRFTLDDQVRVGFYQDHRVVPLTAAIAQYRDATHFEIDLPTSHDLLDFLPPDGVRHREVATLARWVDELGDEDRAKLALPLAAIKLLVPIPRPPKILLLAGNYAAHVLERGGTVAERAETFPYVFMKPPTTTLTHPGHPIVIPRESPDHVDWEAELGVVIGRGGRNIAESDALGHVAGYTVVNDISDRKFTPNPDRKPRERDKFFDCSTASGTTPFARSAPASPRPPPCLTRRICRFAYPSTAISSRTATPVR